VYQAGYNIILRVDSLSEYDELIVICLCGDHTIIRYTYAYVI